MLQMLLIHANYLDEDFRLVQGDIEIEDGKILRVGKDLPRKEEDLAVDCAAVTPWCRALWMCTSTAVPARTPATPPGRL